MLCEYFSSFLYLFSLLCSSMCVLCLVAQLCPALCYPIDCSPPGSPVCGDSAGKNTRVGCHSFLQGIFPTQEWNPGPGHCRWILYRLSLQESPFIYLGYSKRQNDALLKSLRQLNYKITNYVALGKLCICLFSRFLGYTIIKAMEKNLQMSGIFRVPQSSSLSIYP